MCIYCILGMDWEWRVDLEAEKLKPILWETKVLGMDEEILERYPTYAEAIVGNLNVVDAIRKTLREL